MSSERSSSATSDAHNAFFLSAYEEDNDKEEGIPGEQGAFCLSQQLYIDSGNDKKLFYFLSIGVRDNNNEALFSFEKELWSLLPFMPSQWPVVSDSPLALVGRSPAMLKVGINFIQVLLVGIITGYRIPLIGIIIRRLNWVSSLVLIAALPTVFLFIT
jgi:hypothetical protein